MKYLFVVGGLTRGGGAEHRAALLTEGLSKKGQEVYLIVYTDNGNENEYPIADNVIVRRVLDWKKEYIFPRKIQMAWHTMKHTRDIVKDVKPDYILTFCNLATRVFWASTIFMNIKRITAITNNPKLSSVKGVKHKFYKTLQNIFTIISWKIYAQNEYQVKCLPKAFQRKAFILGNPVSCEFTDSTPYYELQERDDYHIISVGRLEHPKNYENLLKAFYELTKQNTKNIILDIYGDGVLRTQVEQRINELSLNANVILHGVVDDVCSVLIDSDMFVLSSDFEGMPNALMEAMAVGLPCVSTDCPHGPAELIQHGVNGMLVPVKDHIALANTMNYLISNTSEAKKLGINAKKHMKEHYTQDAVIERLVLFCEQD